MKRRTQWLVDELNDRICDLSILVNRKPFDMWCLDKAKLNPVRFRDAVKRVLKKPPPLAPEEVLQELKEAVLGTPEKNE